MKGSSSLFSCGLSISLRFTSCRLLCPKLTDAPYSGPGACPLPLPKWRLHSQGPHTLPSQGATQVLLGINATGRVRRFCKKNFFASKRNEAKRNPFRMHFARSREKNFFSSLLFASNFSLPTKAKLIVLFPLCFAYKNISFRFRSFCFASKRNEINVFSLHITILGIDIKK